MPMGCMMLRLGGDGSMQVDPAPGYAPDMGTGGMMLAAVMQLLARKDAERKAS